MLTSDRGRIVDLLTVINAGEFVYLLTSPGQQQPVIEWLDKYTIMEDLEIEDVSDSITVAALAGDGAETAWVWSRCGRPPARPAIPRAHGERRRPRRHRRQPPYGRNSLLPAGRAIGRTPPPSRKPSPPRGATEADDAAWEALRVGQRRTRFRPRRWASPTTPWRPA